MRYQKLRTPDQKAALQSLFSKERELHGLTKRRIPRLQKELAGATKRAAQLKKEIRALIQAGKL